MRVIVGIGFLAVAGLVKFVGIPLACQLPDDFASSSRLIGQYQTLDPTTFDLGAPADVEATRDTTVQRTDGSTAIVESTTVVHLPSGDTTAEYHYAVDRGDYTQRTAPSGVHVRDQHGGVVISRPFGAGTDSFPVYNPFLDRNQQMTFAGTSEVAGRAVYGFSGTVTGEIADRQIAAPYKSAIAELAKTGDGATIPKLLLEMIAADLPPRYAAGLAAVLPDLPNEVPIRFTIMDTTSMMLDKQLGAPLTLAADQTTVLNIYADFTLVPVLPLSRLVLHTDDKSAAESAAYAADIGRKLTIFGTYVPIGSALLAFPFLAAAGLGLRRQVRQPLANPTADPLLFKRVQLRPDPQELTRV